MLEKRKITCYNAYVDINGQYFCMTCGGREKGLKRNIIHINNCPYHGMIYCQKIKKNRKSRSKMTRRIRKSRKNKSRKSRR